jgi:DNA polymerase-3 subunit delta
MAAKQTKTESAGGLLVICGEDGFLVSKECEKQVDALLKDDERGMALYEPRADEAKIADVLDELRTLPFLAKRRVVLIKDAEPFIKENVESLEKYVDKPSPSGMLVMTVASWDKRLRFSKKVQAAGCLIEVGSVKGYQLPAYITTYAQETYGFRLDANCSRLLVELTGDDPGRLCSELDKLVVYVSPRKSITPQDIEALIGHNRMFGAFEVIDAIVAGQAGAAIWRLRNMFASDKSADFTVVGAFGYHFRKLFRAKALIGRGTSAQQAALQAGVKWKQQEFLQQVSRLSLPQIGDILAELGRIDYGIKTGQTTAPVAMERLIMRVFAMQKRSA